MRAVAVANTNIALVKYWGKRDTRLNLPAVGSLSLTLEGLTTRTEVRFDASLGADRLRLNGAPADERALGRVSRLLDLVRSEAGVTAKAEVTSANDFPTAAGLASSASAFAALALAATRAAGLSIDERALSVLARRGSGSAARSIFGGFVRMHRGDDHDATGTSAFAEPLVAAAGWQPCLVVGVTSQKAKETLSTDGMTHTAETSPYYSAWIGTSEADLAVAERAIATGDIETLGRVTEASCFAMHASALAARPAVVYFRGATIDGYHAIAELRKSGTPAWFTCDAGPHVKALTDLENAEKVAARLAEVPGVLSTRICRPGPAVRIVEGTS